MPALSQNERRVLVVAPSGLDAVNTMQVLRKGGFHAEIHHSVSTAAEQISLGCGLLLLTEEALYSAHRAVLSTALSRQPNWSNLPLVLITSGEKEKLGRSAKHGFEPRTHITLLERPLRVATLLATVEVALSTRKQQYEIRDLLEEREKLLASLEERVAERTAKLQAMVAEMEAFSYSVSHDLRSPLRVLDGYSQVLREDYAAQLPPPARKLLDKISNASRRMDLLTQDLLAYTRIANAQITLQPVELDETIADVIESYPSLREVRKFIHVRQPLGVVLAHGPSLVQCFSNLLENAVKFTASGSRPAIEVFAERRGDMIRVIVADCGVGIDPADHERIFGLFERAGDRQIPGTGVGLAIVKKAAERMNGQIGLESIPGKGSQFWIDLRAGQPT